RLNGEAPGGWLTHLRLGACLAAGCGLLLLTVAGQARDTFRYFRPIPSVSPRCASFSAAGGRGQIFVSSSSRLTAKSSRSFIRITSLTAYTVNYMVLTNDGCERSGTIVTPGGNVSIRQAAALAAPTGLSLDQGSYPPTFHWNLTPCADLYHAVLDSW